jgi:hypothetical protein
MEIGQEVYTDKKYTPGQLIDASGIADGLYFIDIGDERKISIF